MTRKPFQNKLTYIINSVTKEQIKCHSNSLADLIMSCARMSNDATYRPPGQGWSKEDLIVAKWMKTMRHQLIRHYDRNIILFLSREAENGSGAF